MPGPRPWVVLVYLVADHDQPQPVGPQLNEIAAAQLEALSVDAFETGTLTYCQVDFTNAEPHNCTFGERRIDVGGVCTPGPETNAADRATLTKFFEDTARDVATRGIENPRYAVIFWGHSVGPSGLFRDPAPFNRNPSLKLPDLRRALEALGRPYVDVVIFQDCWMSSLEVSYELRNIVRYMIASQKIVRPMKMVWPFGLLFTELKRPTSPSNQMVETMVDILTKRYKVDEDADIPFSALTMDAAPGLAEPLSRFATALEDLEGAQKTASRQIMLETLGGDAALLDVRTLCKRLRTANIIRQEALDLERVVNTLVVRHTARPEIDPGLTGISLFRRPSNADIDESVFGRSISLAAYNDLALSEDTGWSTMAFELRFVHV
jgi:hypothetical protein